MKLIGGKENDLYLSKVQWKKIFLAMSIMTICLYIVAMVFSLLGNKYFIFNYQNTQMDNIEKWFKEHHIYSVITWMFSTIEFGIILSFILKKIAKVWYLIIFYVPIAVMAPLLNMPSFVYIIYPFIFYLTIPLIEQKIRTKEIKFKEYTKSLLKLVVAVGITYLFQVMIYVIKAGYFSTENHILPLSGFFIYSLEYDIALSIVLFTITLFLDREKGNSTVWTMPQDHGGFSQTSRTKLQKSSLKKKTNLNQKQRNKIRLLYIRVYLIQIGAFLLLMVLPFLLGKIFEFLVMYFAFAIVRYILGFNYSLHYKKEAICVSVGVVVFGVLSLVVPFFYVVIIAAILIGTGLAILLHLSYRYKGMWLFTKVVKSDKFAVLYTFFDGDLSEHNIMKICNHKGSR